MSVFDSPPCHSQAIDLKQTYPMETPDLSGDALDDMLHRINLQSEDFETSTEREQLQHQADSFINAMENPIGTSTSTRRVGLNTTPNVHRYSHSTPISNLQSTRAYTGISNEYNQFNLQNITPPVPPKWKNNENILEKFRKFQGSCNRIFDGPMAHITNSKVKANMFLIWAGADAEDIYENLHLTQAQQYNLDYIFNAFEWYCEPICNFRAVRWKFRAVHQHDSETIDIYFHQILKLAKQCQFSDIDEHPIDTIVYGCRSEKAQDKLLQMPIGMSLEE